MSLTENPWRDIPARIGLICLCFLLRLPSNKCWWLTKWLYAGHCSTGSLKPHHRADSRWPPAAAPIWQLLSLFQWFGMYRPQKWANVIARPFIRKFHLILHCNSSPCAFHLLGLSLTLKRPQNMNLLPLPHRCPINIWRKLPYLSQFSKQPDSTLLLQFYHF